MKEGLHTENIWEMITQEATKAKGKSYAAVPYFGNKAAELLPLKKGSLLVVNADNHSVIGGVTSPFELEKLFKKGVELHNNPSVHAKIFVINNTLFVGSANVSNNSANYLKEAVWVSKDKIQIVKAIEFIKNLKHESIGQAKLNALKPIFNTKPIYKTIQNKIPYMHVWLVDDVDYSDEFNEVAIELYEEVKDNITIDNRHRIDELESDEPCTNDILVMQVFRSGKTTEVYPFGKVIGNKPFITNGQLSYVIFIQVEEKKPFSIKKLEKYFEKEELLYLQKNHKLPKALASKFINFWNKQ